MHEAFKIFVLSTIVITLWTAFLLLQDKRSIPVLNRWFAAFLVALTTPQMDLYATHTVQGGVFLISIVAFTFLWLKGPFVWIFLKVLTRTPISLKTTWFHFIPWFAALVTTFLTPQFAQIIMLLGMTHMLIYLSFSVYQLAKKKNYIIELWSGFQNSAYYWLLYVIYGLMLLVAIDLVVMSLVVINALETYNLLDYFAFPAFSIYVLSIAVLSVYRPELLFREQKKINNQATPQINTQTNTSVNSLITTQSSSESLSSVNQNQDAVDQKTRYLELDEPLAQALMGELSKLMEEQQIYRQNELSLPDLAQSLGISVHQLSELLNVHLGLSFYDYINSRRLDYACELLKNPDCHLRILDIAFEAGFNNKNSFYRIFKETFGFTPNQYRENVEEVELKTI